MYKVLCVITFFFSILSHSQSENLVDVTWICTNIVIDGNTILPPNDDEVQSVLLRMLNDSDPSTEDFVSNVCDVLSSSDSAVIYNDADVTFTITQLVETLGGCPIHQNFQSSYFGFFGGNINTALSYDINEANNIRTLTITAPNGNMANYEEFILSIKESQIDQIKIYPNPATEILNIDSKIDIIERIEIYSISGQIIKLINTPNSSIDISDISKGIYFLKICGVENFTIKRFIKN